MSEVLQRKTILVSGLILLFITAGMAENHALKLFGGLDLNQNDINDGEDQIYDSSQGEFVNTVIPNISLSSLNLDSNLTMVNKGVVIESEGSPYHSRIMLNSTDSSTWLQFGPDGDAFYVSRDSNENNRLSFSGEEGEIMRLSNEPGDSQITLNGPSRLFYGNKTGEGFETYSLYDENEQKFIIGGLESGRAIEIAQFDDDTGEVRLEQDTVLRDDTVLKADVSEEEEEVIWDGTQIAQNVLEGPASDLSAYPLNSQDIETDSVTATELDQTSEYTGLSWSNLGISQSEIELEGGQITEGTVDRENIDRNQITTSEDTDISDQETVFVSTSDSAETVNLPEPDPGRKVTVKDSAGNAAENMITVSSEADIDGEADYEVSTDYGAVTVTSDGTNWFVTSEVQ